MAEVARAGRWRALAILTLARTAMAFQFQSIAALQHQLTGAQGFSFAFYGWLLGLYLIPGIFAGFTGGWLGQKFGERRVILSGLAMMVAGGLWLAAANSSAGFLGSRAVSGVGAIFLNVLVTKMVADWFEGTDSIVPMGVLVTAWPAGLALAMVALAPLGAVLPLGTVHLLAVAPAVMSAALLLVAYPPDPKAARGSGGGGSLLRGEFALCVVAGVVWALFNVALIVVLGFGPEAFVGRGATAVDAAAAFSATGWAVALATIPGAFFTRWITRRGAMLVTGLLVAAGSIALLVPAGPGVAGTALAALVGFSIGAIAPLIMWLPATVAPPQRRALAYGVYFSVYYVGMSLFPPAVGALRDATGNADTPLILASAMMLASAAFYAVFVGMRRG